MQIWIDVEDSAGNILGDGPITTAQGWSSAKRLDQAGTWSFRLPAGDERAALISHKRVVRCWAAPVGGLLREVGAGRIDKIETVIDPAGGPTMLDVSGDDLLRELATRSVGALNLYEIESYSPAQARYILGEEESSINPGSATLLVAPVGYIYLRDSQTFDSATLTITSGNGVVGEMKAQFLKNEDGVGWETLDIDDGTANESGAPLAHSGTISWTIPKGWGTDGGLYQVRLFAPEKDLNEVTFSHVRINRKTPTMAALGMVMDQAPDGWTLDPAGSTETESEVYLQLNGESVLAALGRVAEQTGEHFVLSPAGRRIRWIGTVQDASGLRAIGGVAGGGGRPDEATLLITQLRPSSDSYEQVTRVYVSGGGGTGQSRLTLARTTRSAPAGWTLNKDESWLEATEVVTGTDAGRIDRVMEWPDISPADISASAEMDAANALFDRAYQYLLRASNVQAAHELEVVPTTYELRPGQTLHVSYDEWVGNYHAVAINATLWVLEVRSQINAAGIMLDGLTVSTIDTWPLAEGRAVAMGLRTSETVRSTPAPKQGLTDVAAGMVAYCEVDGGAVVKMTKRRPVDSGRYQYVDTLTIEDGVITEINDRTTP